MDDEKGINAFAAGFSPDDAVIGVTRGSVEQLDRDQLQGVMAHEFSHILNGDMRLNIRLIGVVHGIMVIGLVGWFVLRSAMFQPRYRSRRKEGSPLPLLGLGLALIVIGYLGVFFGNLIKAAVSRQREYLADAAAVQFTRHAGGIAGALKKIGGFAAGSRIGSPHGHEISHMFFSHGFSSALNALWSTHPPLAERIRRIECGFQGDSLETTPKDVEVPQSEHSQVTVGGGHSGDIASSTTPIDITRR